MKQDFLSLMGSHHHQVAVQVPDEKVNRFDSRGKKILSKQNEVAFIWDQLRHLADEGSPLNPLTLYHNATWIT